MKRFAVLITICLLVMGLHSGLVSADPGGYFILTGDLHCHSEFSHDSEVPVEQVVRETGLAGYDFLALTEHNTTRHMTRDWSTDEVLVIAGYEHTTPAAHVNIFGLRFIPRKSAIYSLEEMEEYLAPLREQGAVIQLDHPNDPLYYSRFGYAMEMDLLEVWNGTWREDDHKTLQDWHQMLVEGRYIPATGGTDAHANHLRRSPYNNVYVQEKSEQAILEALTLGRNFITRRPDGAQIWMECDGEIMGGTVPYREGQTMHIRITNVDPGMILRIYSDQGLHLEHVHTAGGSYNLQLDTSQVRFYRVELWSSEDVIYGFSNPMFIQH
ncbi:MAG TPA: CehA/McbA family metallohydrolase [Limnochordia bacterium]|nr:CehA/McbA family metallohydrolase [Limnochordia bacterium]